MKPFDDTILWSLMLAIVASRREHRAANRTEPQLNALSEPESGRVAVRVAEAIRALEQWVGLQVDNGAVQAFIDLYGPLLFDPSDEPVVIGHLGQSLESCIATASGDSVAMTGPSNHRHLHRMRALCDAIVVGGNTAALDDPRLNTRLVPGDNPVRVIIDPDLRLSNKLALMDDGEARSVIVCKDTALHADSTGLVAAVEGKSRCEVLGVPVVDGELSLPKLFSSLHRLGLRQVFVEGGGITVSRCLQTGVLDRLHIATSAVLVGEGHGALQLPSVASMAQALRPSYRLFRMGDDVLWDLEVSKGRTTAGFADSSEELSADRVEIERLL